MAPLGLSSEASAGVGEEDVAVEGSGDSAYLNLLADLHFFALLDPPGRLLGQLVRPFPPDLSFELLDLLLARVFLKHVEFGLRLLDCRFRSLYFDFGGIEAIIESPAVGGCASRRR